MIVPTLFITSSIIFSTWICVVCHGDHVRIKIIIIIIIINIIIINININGSSHTCN